MTVFERSLEFVKQWEGIDSDHPNDRGGFTRFGISSRAHPDVDVPSLTWEQAVDIYRTRYWGESGANRAPPDLAFALFDSAVQHGPVQAVRLLQRAVDAKVDGVYGPKTEAAVQACESPGLELLAERAVFYTKLIEGDMSQRVFARGWMRRLTYAAGITFKLQEVQS